MAVHFAPMVPGQPPFAVLHCRPLVPGWPRSQQTASHWVSAVHVLPAGPRQVPALQEPLWHCSGVLQLDPFLPGTTTGGGWQYCATQTSPDVQSVLVLHSGIEEQGRSVHVVVCAPVSTQQCSLAHSEALLQLAPLGLGQLSWQKL